MRESVLKQTRNEDERLSVLEKIFRSMPGARTKPILDIDALLDEDGLLGCRWTFIEWR